MKRAANFTVCLLFMVLAAQAVRAQPRGKKPVRALPPTWDRDVLDVFFADAREKLVGERPQFSAVAASRPTGGGARPATGQEEAPSAGGIFAWSKVISPAAIEDEIKKQARAVDETVDIPGKFKGGGNNDARVQFSTIAVMFAIAGEHDGSVRWQDDAPGLRELFAQAGFSCKVGTDQSFNQSKLRKQDLADLIRGERPAAIKEAEAAAQWGKVSDRPPLMKRMETAFQKRLSPWLASDAEFKKNLEDIRHEAEVLAALGEVIQREGFEYYDDEDYLGYAKQMRDAAHEISEAAKLDNYDKARAASGNISKACSTCHEGYRS